LIPQTIREKGFTGRPTDYDDEFKYDDGRYGGQYFQQKDVEAKTAALIRQIEYESDVVKSSNQTVEEYRRLFEANALARKDYRWPNQEELKTQREGRILHMNEFLRLLRSAGLKAWCPERGGMPGTLGLFVYHEGLLPGCGHNWGFPHYVAFIQVPFMQEYEELYFDDYDVPLGPKRRGWRTVLLRLIEQGLLTEQKAHEVFGRPQSGWVSRRYREYLAYLRGRPFRFGPTEIQTNQTGQLTPQEKTQ
jgi:hypothetical protein